MTLFDGEIAPTSGSRARATALYAVELVTVALVYFVLAKIGLQLASINPSATPIWPPTGVALAAVLIGGYRIAPAILIASFAANLTTAGTITTSVVIGCGNMLEGIVGAWLVSRWSGGRHTFSTPGNVARFALISFLPTALSASVGVGTLTLSGFAAWPQFGSIWLTWWLGDFVGALVLTPVIVLWADSDPRLFRRSEFADSLVLFAVTSVIGVIAFSPLVEQTVQRAPLSFLAMLPLLWAALRRNQRDTATVAFILCSFAVWATLNGGGPFGRESMNESFLLLLMLMISVSVPSLALSADVTVRKRAEAELRRARDELNLTVDARTAALRASNRALQEEVDRRKWVEAELEQQRAHLMEAQRLANLGSWVRDIASDTSTWSDQLYDMYGLKRGEYSGSLDNFLALVHPDDRPRVREQFGNALKTGRGFRDERRIIRPNGEIRYLQNCVEVVKDADGNVRRLFGISHDVTERREAELALERTRELLAQVQKMEALGQLTGGIAHDFNNLLMIVSGHAEMLRRRLTEPKALQGIEAVLTAARRGESLTRQLLTFSRRQSLNPVPIDLGERVAAMRAMLESSLHGNIDFVVDIPLDIWPVAVDVSEFELALVNVAVNARDAMQQGGTFTLSARNVAARTGRGSLLTADHVELSLTDTGAGIPPDVIQKIFDPFFTTKAVGKGTGLGLSQVYGFAHQSGGTIRVSSVVGSGTTILLGLPRSQAAPGSAAEAEAAELRVIRPGEGTILVVEDNPAVCEVTATLLEQIGYRVVRAENARDALAKLQGGGVIDLVFSDIVMPHGMNGIHLAQEVSERYPDIGILLTTGYSDVAAAAGTRFAILRKPFALSSLERAIAEAIASAASAARRRAQGAVG
jgi:PAS domain S-box-containing protein